jgi:uncharacterized membrane protein
MTSKNTSVFAVPFVGRKLFVISFAISACLASVSIGQEKVDFVKTIQPIFEQHCVVCHGPVEQEDEENDFRIDDREDALDFIGEDGAEDSDLFQLMVSEEEEELMPPPEHSKLTPAQLASVKTWIDEGADWPEGIELVDKSKKDENAADSPKSVDSEDEAAKKADKKTEQIFNAIGSLHTAAIHLPIGLLLASGLFAFFSLRGNFVMSDCAYYCLWLGTLGAIVACVTGWWYSPMEHRGDVTQFADLLDQTQDIFWHRTGGLVVTAAALLLALFAAGARNRDPDDGMLWKLGLILLAGGIGWVGHTGGELAYPNHYKDLNAVYQSVIGGSADKGEAKEEEAREEDSAEVGETSDEADSAE